MAITKSNINQQTDYLRLRDLFGICIGKWRWFVLSLFFL